MSNGIERSPAQDRKWVSIDEVFEKNSARETRQWAELHNRPLFRPGLGVTPTFEKGSAPTDINWARAKPK